MRVQFHKTDDRRYSVAVLREGQEPLQMLTAPGNDPLMPHDLQHFIVEQELGIELGVFGQLAAGGTARTFFGKTNDRKTRRRGERLSRAGRDDGARSERAVYVSTYHWLAASSDPALKRRAAAMADAVKSTLAGMQGGERSAFDARTVARISARMDSLSQRWAATPAGDCLEVEW